MDLCYKGLDPNDAIALANALATNTTITTLNAATNNLGSNGVKALAQSTTLATLDISNNCIRDEGALALARNTSLRTLDVRGNEIEGDGAKALARNTTLTTLNISFNYIGSDGAWALARNTSLRTLDVSCNNIRDEGAQALARNATLTTLYAYGNSIEDAGVHALAVNTTLTTLSICDKDMRYVLCFDQTTRWNKVIAERKEQFEAVARDVAKGTGSLFMGQHEVDPSLALFVIKHGGQEMLDPNTGRIVLSNSPLEHFIMSRPEISQDIKDSFRGDYQKLILHGSALFQAVGIGAEGLVLHRNEDGQSRATVLQHKIGAFVNAKDLQTLAVQAAKEYQAKQSTDQPTQNPTKHDTGANAYGAAAAASSGAEEDDQATVPGNVGYYGGNADGIAAAVRPEVALVGNDPDHDCGGY